MDKSYRILGKRGRITIPFEIRQELGFVHNDVVSFTVEDDRTVVVKREKICNDCRNIEPDAHCAISLRDFLNGLPEQEQRAALHYLSVKLESKAGRKLRT